jgi:hypothetical protein
VSREPYQLSLVKGMSSYCLKTGLGLGFLKLYGMGNSAGSSAKLVQFCVPIRPINRQRKAQRAAAETEIFHIT